MTIDKTSNKLRERTFNAAAGSIEYVLQWLCLRRRKGYQILYETMRRGTHSETPDNHINKICANGDGAIFIAEHILFEGQH